MGMGIGAESVTMDTAAATAAFWGCDRLSNQRGYLHMATLRYRDKLDENVQTALCYQLEGWAAAQQQPIAGSSSAKLLRVNSGWLGLPLRKRCKKTTAESVRLLPRGVHKLTSVYLNPRRELACIFRPVCQKKI